MSPLRMVLNYFYGVRKLASRRYGNMPAKLFF
ncbi:hypothetical protein [Caudoviricetes sp.]|nr:hypothetical protein [Caudoviricetes sp.]